MAQIESNPNNQLSKPEEKGDRALIAIIDDAIDIFHEEFLDADGQTRIIAIWDQTDNSASLRPLPTIGFGRTYEPQEINEYIRGERSTNLNRSSFKHGTQVTSIAAGRTLGIAPESKIIVVIPQIDDKTGFGIGYSAALDYIRKIAEDHNMPVVVNISQGFNLGAHDGTSLFEEECDNFSDDGEAPGLVIVKSAGNERDKRSHAELVISEKRADIQWDRQESLRDSDTQEPPRARIQIRFPSNDSMAFTLINPRGIRSTSVSFRPEAKQKVHKSFPNNGDSYVLDYTQSNPRNGDSILSISIYRNDGRTIEVGTWTLEIQDDSIGNQDDKKFHAWTESIPNRKGTRDIRFINHISERITLTIPGTAKTIISVGSVISTEPFDVTSYSSCGLTRDNRNQPVLVAVGENIEAAMYSNDCVRHSTTSFVNGTSFAAPQVTGAIALLLSARAKRRDSNASFPQFNISNIRELVISTMGNANREWQFDRGYGILNLQQLLDNGQHFIPQGNIET